MSYVYNWTEADLATYLARFRDPPVFAPDVESDTSDGSAPADEAKEIHKRFNIVVHHRSRRLADATGRSHKACVDGLIRGGLLPDDSPQYVKEITETFEQRNNEETVIELWQIEGMIAGGFAKMNDDEKRKVIKQAAKKITEQLSDQGKIIEGGWRGFELIVLPESAGKVQRDEMRKAFFFGAQHLLGSIMTVLKDGVEPTDTDLHRMKLINEELDNFVEEMKRAMIFKHGADKYNLTVTDD